MHALDELAREAPVAWASSRNSASCNTRSCSNGDNAIGVGVWEGSSGRPATPAIVADRSDAHASRDRGVRDAAAQRRRRHRQTNEQ